MSDPVEPTRDALQCWDREIVWHAFTQMAEYEPLIIERARGCTLVDIDGRELLDGVSSLWCNVHGHRHPRLDEALRQQIDLGVNVSPMEIADRAESENTQFIALSSLMTTSMPYQRDVVELLQGMGVRDKYYVVVGGGPVTADFAQSIGADGWGLNAVAAVRVCDKLLELGQRPPLARTLTVE